MKLLRRTWLVSALVVGLVASAAPANGSSDDPFNGSWSAVGNSGTGLHIVIGGEQGALGTHYVVLQADYLLDQCLHGLAHGVGVITEEEHLRLSANLYCVDPGSGRVLFAEDFGLLVVNDDFVDTLTLPTVPAICLYPTGHPEACDDWTWEW